MFLAKCSDMAGVAAVKQVLLAACITLYNNVFRKIWLSSIVPNIILVLNALLWSRKGFCPLGLPGNFAAVLFHRISKVILYLHLESTDCLSCTGSESDSYSHLCLDYIEIFCSVMDDIIRAEVCVRSCTASYWSALFTQMNHMTIAYLVTWLAQIMSHDLKALLPCPFNYNDIISWLLL